MTNAEAWFNIALRPRKPAEGSLGRTAQDGHRGSHTAPEFTNTTKHKVTLAHKRFRQKKILFGCKRVLFGYYRECVCVSLYYYRECVCVSILL